MRVWNETRYLFVTVNPGFGGHQLGRQICSGDDVYWYDTSYNGSDPLSPIEVFNSWPEYIKGPRKISKFHFHRGMCDGYYVPGVSDLIFNHWDSMVDWKSVFDFRMTKIHDVEEQYLLWVVHTHPEKLLEIFPNSKVINKIGYDVSRYMETSAKFPYYYEFNGQKPSTPNSYTIELETLHKKYPDMTVEDYWNYTNEGDFKKHVKKMLSEDRYVEHENVTNI